MEDYHEDPISHAVVPTHDVTPEEHDRHVYDDEDVRDDHSTRDDHSDHDDNSVHSDHGPRGHHYPDDPEGIEDDAPEAPPPLIEDLMPPRHQPMRYEDQPQDFFHQPGHDQPITPTTTPTIPTTPTTPTTPIFSTAPLIPVMMPPRLNATPQPIHQYPEEPTYPSPRSHSTLSRDQPALPREQTTLPRDHSTLTRNHSKLSRDQSTLPRDHGEMDDRASARNTVLSYRTDRTTRTMDPEAKAKARKVYRSALTHLMCGLYALILIVIGLVFSLSTVLTCSMEKGSMYLQVFLLYIYGVSLFFLMYLHCCLMGRRKSRGNGSSHHVNLVSNNQLDHDKCSIDYNHDVDVTSNMSKDKRSRSRSRSHTDFEEGIESLANEFDSVTFDANGINFYLRLGAIAFGIGSMIHNGFRIASLFVDGEFSLDCRGPLYVAVALSHMMFTFFQTFYLFKNHKVVINKHKAFVRFGFMHMVATNMCVWLVTTITEIAESIAEQREVFLEEREIINGSGESPTEFTASILELDCPRLYRQSLASMASPYLFPCTIEYSLIAAAVLYKMYCNVGSVGRHNFNDTESAGSLRLGCHKANKGLFLGLFVAVLTLISVSCFFVITGTIYNYGIGQLLYFGTELVLLVLSCTVVIVGFARLQRLRFLHEASESQLDMMLLVISFFGICVLNIFMAISAINNLLPFDLVAMLTIATSGMALLQAALQTIFIMDGLRRCAESQHHVETKPGRALVTFLLLCNLSLWVVNTFEVEKADEIPMHQDFYGVLAWKMITHVCIPLLIFFRFHSTVCLSDIWINAYKIKKKEL